MKEPQFSVRMATEADREGIIRLVSELHGADMTGRFARFYRGNPHGAALTWVAVDDKSGRIEAVTSIFPRYVLVDGRRRRGSIGGDCFVAPRARRLGLATRLHVATTMTHDYERHGTTTFFAALNVATGHVIHECMPRRRHQEFLKFIKTVERSVDPDLETHVIPDNATHKREKVRNWLARYPRVHFHFVPTDPTPFVWTKSAQEILTKIDRGLKALATLR